MVAPLQRLAMLPEQLGAPHGHEARDACFLEANHPGPNTYAYVKDKRWTVSGD
jgi:hypothetical protein